MNKKINAKEIEKLFEESVYIGENRTNLSEVDISNQKIDGLNLSCSDFGNSDLTKTIFVDCDLRGSTFDQAKMNGAKMVRCQIFGCSFPQNNAYITFENCYRSLTWTPDQDKKKNSRTKFNKLNNSIEIIASLSIDKLLAISVLVAFVTILAMVLRLT